MTREHAWCAHAHAHPTHSGGAVLFIHYFTFLFGCRRYEQWLRAQIAQYDTALAAEQLTIDQAQDPPFQPDDQDKDSVLLDMIDAVKVELREVAAERGRELDLVSRMRRTAVLTKAMFPDDTAECRFTLDPAVSERVSERVHARDALVVKFLKCKEEVAAMEATLMSLSGGTVLCWLGVVERVFGSPTPPPPPPPTTANNQHQHCRRHCASSQLLQPSAITGTAKKRCRGGVRTPRQGHSATALAHSLQPQPFRTRRTCVGACAFQKDERMEM